MGVACGNDSVDIHKCVWNRRDVYRKRIFKILGADFLNRMLNMEYGILRGEVWIGKLKKIKF